MIFMKITSEIYNSEFKPIQVESYTWTLKLYPVFNITCFMI